MTSARSLGGQGGATERSQLSCRGGPLPRQQAVTFLPSLGSGARHQLSEAEMGRRMVWPRAGRSQVCGEPPPYNLGPLLVGMVLFTLTAGRPCEWGSRDQRMGFQIFPAAPSTLSLLFAVLPPGLVALGVSPTWRILAPSAHCPALGSSRPAPLPSAHLWTLQN